MMLRNLDRLARAHGGAVYMLNGNHESLNIAGDFRCGPLDLSSRHLSLTEQHQLYCMPPGYSSCQRPPLGRLSSTNIIDCTDSWNLMSCMWCTHSRM